MYSKRKYCSAGSQISNGIHRYSSGKCGVKSHIRIKDALKLSHLGCGNDSALSATNQKKIPKISQVETYVTTCLKKFFLSFTFCLAWYSNRASASFDA